MKSENINELSAALAKAQSEMQDAELDGWNPHFKSSYSTLSAVWAACRAPLSKNGLAVLQGIEREDQGFILRTTLTHSSGQWIESVCPIISSKNDMQGIGSAISYARRYSLQAMVGVASKEDDDGEGAQGRDAPRKQESAKNPPTKPQENSKPSAPPVDPKIITEQQRKLFMVEANNVGMPEDIQKELIGKWGYKSRLTIEKKDFDAILHAVKTWLK